MEIIRVGGNGSLMLYVAWCVTCTIIVATRKKSVSVFKSMNRAAAASTTHTLHDVSAITTP